MFQPLRSVYIILLRMFQPLRSVYIILLRMFQPQRSVHIILLCMFQPLRSVYIKSVLGRRSRNPSHTHRHGKVSTHCSFSIQSNLDISKLLGLFFHKFKLPEVQINFALRVIWTCEKVFKSKLWLEKAIKMYF